MSDQTEHDQGIPITPENLPEFSDPPVTTTNTEGEKIDQIAKTVDANKIVRPQRVAGPKGSPFQEFDRTYQQRKLSSFPRLRFTRIMTRTLKAAMGGEDGEKVEIASLMQNSGLSGSITSANADQFISAILSLAMDAENVMKEIYMLSLSIPRSDQPIVSEIWDMPAYEDGTGGLSDEDEQAMIQTFVDQNAEAIADFFRKTVPGLWARVQSALNPTQDS